MEFFWEIASWMISIIRIGGVGFSFYRFAQRFFGKRKHIEMIGITYFIIMLFLKVIPYYMDGVVAYALGAASVFIVMYLIDRSNINQKIYVAVIMYLTEWIAFGIALIPRDILYAYMVEPPFIAQTPVLQFILHIVMELVYIVLSLGMMTFLFYIVDKMYTYKRENMNKKELGLMLATPLSVFAGNVVVSFCANAYESDMDLYIWFMHSEYFWIRAVYQIISFTAIIVVIIIYQSIKDNHRKEKGNVLLADQIEYTKRHIREIERMYQDIRGLRHDMGNHVLILENLFMKNEPQETENYLLNLKEQLYEITPQLASGNPITDMILMEKKKEAEEKGIDFYCDFHYPQGTDIDAFDVSIILNNALTNAIEAAAEGKNPYICISSYVNKNAYMIEIKNSFDKKLEINEESGLPVTSKTDKESHGYGLVNIKKVARNYMGDIDIEQKGQSFFLSIMLMLK